MTTTEAAERLGITPGRIRQAILTGTIRARKQGRDWTISHAEVERYRRERLGRLGRPRGT